MITLKPHQKRLLKLAAVLAGVGLLLFVFVKIAPYIAPLIIALLIYAVAAPLAKFMQHKLKINNRIAAALCVMLLVGAVVTLLALLVARVVSEVQSVIQNFPAISEGLYSRLDTFMTVVEEQLLLLHPSLSDTILSAVRTVMGQAGGAAASVAKSSFGLVMRLPRALIFIVATIVCAFMLIMDREKIKAFFYRHTPDAWLRAYTAAKSGLLLAILGYIRAQLVMLCVTFCELLLGFSLLGVRYALLLALGIALIDMLPMFGSGLFIIPWFVYSFVTGNYTMGVGLLILYAVTLIMRQIIEPRVLGKNIGVYPMLTLLALYAGLRLWGVIGLFMGPITVLLYKAVITYVLNGKTLKDYISGL